jgi:glutamate-1-semialdehyde 2,1-aminomutase
MLNKGVYTVYGGGAVSMSHTDKDIEHIIKAAEASAEEMAQQKM